MRLGRSRREGKGKVETRGKIELAGISTSVREGCDGARLDLSSALCNKYLVDLKGAGYIAESGRLWETTKKGRQVIDACRDCRNLIGRKAPPTR